jgi:hypothetical protein
MPIKQKLLEAAKSMTVAVELDSIFESAQLSPEVKTQFQMVFETAVKSQAIKLAETHINEIAEQSNALVETQVQGEIAELQETLNKYLDHVAKHWLEENTLAVDNSIKVAMFESMMVGLKELFVENNVTVPEESVDVVAELEAEIAESREELNASLNENAELAKSINVLKRDAIVESSIASLAESQKEKVKDLVEGLEFNELFGNKLSAIVEMTAGKQVVEAAQEVAEAESVIAEAQEEALNFQADEVIVEAEAVNPMAQYLTAL